MKHALSLSVLCLAQCLLFGAGEALALDASTCTLVPAVSLDMTTGSDGRVAIPVRVLGHSYKFGIDTGSPMSAVSDQLATDLSLPRKPAEGYSNGHDMNAYASAVVLAELVPNKASVASARDLEYSQKPGQFYSLASRSQQPRQYVVPDDFSLGSAHGAGFKFYVIPDTSDKRDGYLGPDILRNYDVDFDFGQGRFALFGQNDCANPIYWTREPAAILTIFATGGHEESRDGRRVATMASDAQIRVPVKVDGRGINAVLDTGSSVSFLNVSTAGALGISRTALKVQSSDANGNPAVYTYPFASVDFGGVVVKNPVVEIYPDSAVPKSNAINIGMEILHQLHVYVSYKNNRVYMTAAAAH